MKRYSKILALFLALMLLMSGCGSNPDSYAEKVAATYGDQTVYLDEANFWLRYEQMGYSYIAYIYQYYYGVSNIWALESGRRTQTYEESAKEDTMAAFLQMFILLDHADEYKITLNDDDYAKIDAIIAELRTDYADSLFAESAIGSYPDAKLRESIAQRTKAVKVWNAVREQATVNVSDEDTKSFSVHYFQITSSAKITPEGGSELTGEAIAEYLTNELVHGTSFETLKSTFSTLTAGDASYRWNDEDTMNRPQNRLGRVLTDGRVTWQKDGDSWYVVQCISADDKDAAAEARATLESRQKEAHFNEVYAEWAKSAKKFSVKKAFNDLPIIISE